MSWLELVVAALDFVRDECKRQMNCSACRLSDAEGVCPFHGPNGQRVLPSEWRLEEVSDFKEPRFED